MNIDNLKFENGILIPQTLPKKLVSICYNKSNTYLFMQELYKAKIISSKTHNPYSKTFSKKEIEDIYSNFWQITKQDLIDRYETITKSYEKERKRGKKRQKLLKNTQNTQKRA